MNVFTCGEEISKLAVQREKLLLIKRVANLSISQNFSKLLLQKIHFRKLFSLKTLPLIYSSSESSEKLSKSSIIFVTIFIPIYLHSFEKTWIIVLIFLECRIQANYC